MSDYLKEFVLFREATDWNLIRKDHLRPEIGNLSDYHRELGAGIERALGYLKDRPTTVSAADLGEAHRLMFGQIYTDAGKPRSEGPAEQADGHVGSAGDLVARDLADMQRYSERAFSTDGIEARIEAATLDVASMLKIRPFHQGNEEASRLVFAHELRKEFQQEDRPVGRPMDGVDRRDYAVAQEQASRIGEKGCTLLPLRTFAIDFARQGLQVEAERIDRKMREAATELKHRG